VSRDTALLFLPGLAMTPGHVEEARFADALTDAGYAVDLVVPPIDSGRYAVADGIAELRREWVAPLRARYRNLWLGGISMGGFLAMALTADHPGDADGLCLIAPYPGNRLTQGAIKDAGGPGVWQPSEEQLRDPEFRVWHWLRTAPDLPVFWGYGSDDRFASGMALLGAPLPPESRHVRPGGHDWPVWQLLWQDFLDEAWLNKSVAVEEGRAL
jgi:pimeloyl-ACP methyl ester carboxylesterase